MNLFLYSNQKSAMTTNKIFPKPQNPHSIDLVSESRFELHPSQIQIRVMSCCFSVLTFQTVNQNSHFGWYEYVFPKYSIFWSIWVQMWHLLG